MNLMKTHHPDAVTIERIGRKVVREHFGLSPQSLYYWRKSGVPRSNRGPMRLLGESLGHDMSDFPIESENSAPQAGRSGEPVKG